MVVAVVDDVVVVDGGCAGVVVGDVAMSRGVLGCVSRGAVCVPASTVVVALVWVHTSQCISFSVYGPATGGFCPLAMVQLIWAHGVP